jgi:serine/threonine protein kinase
MNQNRWQQIDELFDAVLEIPESEREDFLSKKCNGDEDLKKEVLSLLKAQDKADNFMENSAMNLMAKAIAGDQTNVFENSLYNKTLGNYKIEKPLGAGGMGEVYLAHDTKLNRKAALKILPKEFVSDGERVKRFEIEARAVSALNHPYIVTVYDVGNVEGVNYIATEYVEGKTVRELIGGDLSVKETLSIISQTAEALAAAHKAGVIHRDIKPENIMVRPDGYVKVLDFGLAKLTETNPTAPELTAQTMKGAVIGTLAYMSPEQVIGDKIDHRTDLWSLGVVLYEMLTAKNPFKSENRQATFNSILSFEPPFASELNPQVSAELDRVLIKALEKDTEMSYQTASDFCADIKRVKREFDSSPSWSTRSLEIKMQKRADAKSRKSLLIFASAFLLLLLGGFSAWIFYFKKDAPQTIAGVDWTKANNVQLTDSLSVESYPSLSPDGKTLVFSMESEDNQDIFSQRVGGKNVTNLTKDSKKGDTMPAFSPDGKHIAFRSEREPKGIYLMEATAENVRRVSDVGFHPSWSPDGAKIVVSERASTHHTLHTVPNSSLWIIDVNTGNKQQLDTKGDAIMPSWSPNGQRIAYWFVQEGKSGEIATVPASGGEPVVITNDAFSDWNPVWSPDGKFLYFASDRGGSMSLWRVAIDEATGKSLGEPEAVSTPSKYCRHITFSRDGNLLAYVRYESKSNLQSVAFDEKAKKPVGEINWVTRGNHEITNPHLSPGGEEYVIRNVKATQEDLIIFNKDGANWRNLTNDKFLERIPSWSHDGKKIVFHSDRSGKYQVWMIDADGSNLRQITFSEKTGAYVGVFSPDDSKLVFTEIDGKTQKPFVLDLTKTWAEQTPQPLQINENCYSWVGGWSPDGNKLLFMCFDATGNVNAVAVYDLRTSTYEKMTDIGSSPFWLSDNRHFIYSTQKGIYLCDSETKKITEIFTPSAYEIQGVNISADYKMLYFRYLQVDADIWLLEASKNQ